MKKKLFKIIQILTVSLILSFLAQLSSATSNKHHWPMWEANNPLSKKRISHQEWQTFLERNVFTNKEGINMIDYANMAQEDKKLLRNYLHRLSTINIDNYNRKEQLAYWINLYNALTVRTVAKYYPVTSIKDIKISPGLFSIGPWGANLIVVTNTALSLDEIENRIIRPIWNDPRVHYALNNASIGAANLSKKAYQGDTLDEQLNEAATNYINSLRGVQVIEGKLIVSKIYEWYAEDFGENKQDILEHIKQVAREPLRSQLKHINTIDSYVYNWHLNAPALS
ncbi:DUF547 domain-containing protein [Legionella israelensis]|uniref:Putative Ser/Thr protein kinase n=1 Tax=Legionella israelensis TaxID=454 RepID=A0A0W0VN27_9GAMM|nr:DUF547 domain-containing protein [Legionella israelensis]KTD21484.1 putative Ser/Thr protein kinase [Legionella israelensis]QBS11126.1 DUF547 domain-containing protein [Legionella israelensis]SCX78824.1 Protein of unknown function, DUF547 [Legionella israelensis DSM 19235]STX59636.1 putative Ser/Thr protein kinase [Legionella israelensis]